MQNKNQHKDFDQLFKERLEGGDMTPSPAVWDKIEARLGEKKKKRPFIFWWLGLGILLLGGGATLLYFTTFKTNDDAVNNKITAVADAQAGKEAVQTSVAAVSSANENNSANAEAEIAAEEAATPADYRIQVGNFSSKKEKALFSSLGTVLEAQDEKGNWHYYAGPYSKPELAALQLNSVRQKGFKDAFLVEFKEGKNRYLSNEEIARYVPESTKYGSTGYASTKSGSAGYVNAKYGSTGYVSTEGAQNNNAGVVLSGSGNTGNVTSGNNTNSGNVSSGSGNTGSVTSGNNSNSGNVSSGSGNTGSVTSGNNSNSGNVSSGSGNTGNVTSGNNTNSGNVSSGSGNTGAAIKDLQKDTGNVKKTQPLNTGLAANTDSSNKKPVATNPLVVKDSVKTIPADSGKGAGIVAVGNPAKKDSSKQKEEEQKKQEMEKNWFGASFGFNQVLTSATGFVNGVNVSGEKGLPSFGFTAAYGRRLWNNFFVQGNVQASQNVLEKAPTEVRFYKYITDYYYLPTSLANIPIYKDTMLNDFYFPAPIDTFWGDFGYTHTQLKLDGALSAGYVFNAGRFRFPVSAGVNFSYTAFQKTKLVIIKENITQNFTYNNISKEKGHLNFQFNAAIEVRLLRRSYLSIEGRLKYAAKNISEVPGLKYKPLSIMIPVGYKLYF